MWPLVLVGAHAKVLDGLARVALAADQDGVGAGGGAGCELVEGENLTAGLEDALAGRGGEAEGGDGELGELRQADVVGDRAHDDDHFRLELRHALCLDHELLERHRRAIDLREVQALKDRLLQVQYIIYSN